MTRRRPGDAPATAPDPPAAPTRPFPRPEIDWFDPDLDPVDAHQRTPRPELALTQLGGMVSA